MPALKEWNVRAAAFRRSATSTAEQALDVDSKTVTWFGRWKNESTKDLYDEYMAAQTKAAVGMSAAGYAVLGSSTAAAAAQEDQERRSAKARAKQPDDEFDLSVTLTPDDGVPATRALADCENALRVNGVRYNDLKHVGDELKVDFRVASRVALAGRADHEAARIHSAEPEHGEGAVLAHVNGVGAGELGSTPGNDNSTVHDAEGSSGADD